MLCSRLPLKHAAGVGIALVLVQLAAGPDCVECAASAKAGLGYALVALARATTNMLTTQFTLALYSQLVTQIGPLIVSLLSNPLT